MSKTNNCSIPLDEHPEAAFARLFAEAEASPEYWEEFAKLDFTESVLDAMKAQGIQKSDLARSLGVRPSAITKMLSGDNNFEIGTMTKIAFTLGCRLTLNLTPRSATVTSTPKPLMQVFSNQATFTSFISTPSTVAPAQHERETSTELAFAA